jgi:phosphatidylglycerophosphatase C
VSGRKIAFFDFDGTITTRDSFLEFIKFQKGRRAFYLGFLRFSPWLIALKLKLVPNDRVKQKILVYFFKGMPESVFQQSSDAFAIQSIPAMIRPAALEEIKKLKTQEFDLVIVSASAGNWLQAWTREMGLALIATRLEVKEGLMTGLIEGKNCHGMEKVRRIREEWNLAVFQEIYAYGDTPGDKPMLALGTRSFYKPFRGE